MDISRIKIQNFKNFSDVEVEFAPGVNLFVGGNGCGKTSILEAINVVLGSVLTNLNPEFDRKIYFSEIKITNGIREDDAIIKCEFKNKSINVVFIREFKPETGIFKNNKAYGKPISNEKNLIENDYFENLFGNFNKSETIVPLIAYYSTQRLFKDDTLSQRNIYDPANGKLNGYIDCLKENSIKKLLNDWLGKAVTTRATLAIKEIDKINVILENVEVAIRKTLILFLDLPLDFKLKIYLDSETNEVFVNYDSEHDLPLNYYSDGLRNLIYLVFDMVWRSSQLNPWLTLDEITEKVNGVVTIDEIDLHLHPRWQTKVIKVLQDFFPNVQFFITTHSPTVVANFENGTLYVINDNKIERFTGKYFAREINDVLINVLGASDRHKPTQEKINLLLRLIDDDDKEKYEPLLQKLTKDLGADDFELMQANTLIEMKNWKI